MPNLSANEIVTNKHVRNFIQFGGPGPDNPVKFGGQDFQYMKVEGVSLAGGDGGLEPIWMHDPQYPGKFKLVARKISPPDLTEATLVLAEKHGAIPRQLQTIRCPFNLYDVVGACKDLSDFLAGWSDYVMVYEGAIISGNKDGGNRSAWGDADDEVTDSLPLTMADAYPVGAIGFDEEAAATITLEAIDVIYWSAETCGDCGPANDGTQWIYAVVKSSGSTPGTAPKLLYTIDGGLNWTTNTVTGLGQTEDPIFIDRAGKYLIIGTRTAGGPTLSGYYYAEVNTNTGAPGTWTKVTSGFVATMQIYDCYVLSPREVFFCADGGYIYKAADITTGVTVVSDGSATTTAMRRIHGNGNETLVAVGGSGVVIKSNNRGATWGTTVTYPVVSTLQALAVLDDKAFWVGTSGGTLWYTLNGGETWTQKTFSGSGAGQIRDIVFPTPSVGYFAHDTAAPVARIFATWNGGADWTNSAPRIMNWPVADRVNRIAYPKVSSGIAANNVAVAGLAGDGTDGFVFIGVASRL